MSIVFDCRAWSCGVSFVKDAGEPAMVDLSAVVDLFLFPPFNKNRNKLSNDTNIIHRCDFLRIARCQLMFAEQGREQVGSRRDA